MMTTTTMTTTTMTTTTMTTTINGIEKSIDCLSYRLGLRLREMTYPPGQWETHIV
jgi:hypothetical protein